MSEKFEYKLSLSDMNQTTQGFLIPILPESIEINDQGNVKNYEIVGSGPVNVIQSNSLSKISFQSFFPADTERFGVDEEWKPMRFVNHILQWLKSGKPIRLIYVGENVDINFPVSIDSFDWKESAGSPGDIEYSIKLQKYVFHSPRKVIVATQTNGAQTARQAASTRADGREQPATYKIVAGDTLIRIARKTLGKDSRWKEIQKLNGISDAQLKKLQIGQILKLPKKG